MTDAELVREIVQPLAGEARIRFCTALSPVPAKQITILFSYD
jgi:hypothetical protein